MRLLTRYILREILSHAALGLVVFTFVLFIGKVGEILELVVRNSAPLPSLAQLIFLALPTALTVTIPMSVLVGILIGLSRLAADSEVTAMRASGLGIATFLWPVALVAVASWLIASLNTLVVAPRSAAALAELENQLKTSQVSFQVEPRVFYENFPKTVLYVEDFAPQDGQALWKKIFLADISDPSSPTITFAQQGVAAAQSPDSLALHLSDGYIYETTPKDPAQSVTRGFKEFDLAVPLPPAPNKPPKELAPIPELGTRELYRQVRMLRNAQAGQGKDSLSAIRYRWDSIELNRRFALPAACLVLAAIGVPLGLSARKGGKATGFVLTIALVFIYYFLSLGGVSLGRLDKIPPSAGVWLGNFVFLAAGLWLVWRANLRPLELDFHGGWKKVRHLFRYGPSPGETTMRLFRRGRLHGGGFPQILDDYVLRDFVVYLLLILGAFVVLGLVFNLFELLNDILRNRVAWLTVGEFLASSLPSAIYYPMAPMSVLIAVLITFGLMEKANEITAMKATGISIYRVVVPVLALAGIIAAGLFFFNEYYLPAVNRQQEALRNTIKGKPAQTFLRPDRMWMMGARSTIYYYEFFDADRNSFGNISVFEFDPASFSLKRRIFAARAHWEPELDRFVFEQGWTRSFNGPAIQDFRPFDVSTFKELEETPAYFKKEIKLYTEMSSSELSRYIADMQRSGFEVTRLRVQLQEKFAYPLITLVMAVLAIPFSLQAAKRGALAGVAVALGIAIVYFMVSRLFEAMGNLNQLPPALAAWAPDMLFALSGGYLILKVST